MVHYDGDDEEDAPTEIIVNPVEFADCKAIASVSNKVPSKFNETSKELSERWETASDVHVETNTNPDITLMDEIQHAVVHIIPATEDIEKGNIEKCNWKKYVRVSCSQQKWNTSWQAHMKFHSQLSCKMFKQW